MEQEVKDREIEKELTHPFEADANYMAWIRELVSRYRSAQIRAAMRMSTEMLQFYWTLGRDIECRQMENQYGSHFYEYASRDLQHSLGINKGLSERSLRYTKRFYQLYSPVFENDFPILRQDAAELSGNQNLQQDAAKFTMLMSIPWTHHQKIIDKVKGNTDKALFFVRKTLQNDWGRAMLQNALTTDMYERQGASVDNFPLTLPEADSDLARDLIKGSYQFGFTDIAKIHNERDLKNQLVDHIRQFLIELGRGFSFVGQEYRIEAAGHEKYIDLLFYIIPLHRYCVIEVKTTEFDFPDAGQIAGYMGMVDDVLNTPGDNECIGLLICQSKDNVFAQYALSKINAPIGIAEYDLQRYLPTPQEIQQALKK